MTTFPNCASSNSDTSHNFLCLQNTKVKIFVLINWSYRSFILCWLLNLTVNKFCTNSPI